MAYTIALAGKGGTGKTTTCGLLIHYLSQQGKGPILAVDADSNSNLNEVLGQEIELTLGDVREEVAKSGDNPTMPGGMTKQEYTDYRFNQALVEADHYDMLVMGKPQGQGCYCYVNNVLRSQIEKFASNYKYVVVDNEAGMEHISRGVLPAVDTILLVSDCSKRGIQAVGRIAQLVKELNLNAKQVKLIVNRAPDGKLNDAIKAEIEKLGLDLVGVLPQDNGVYEYDSDGRAIISLPEDSPVKVAMRQIIEKLDL